MESGRGTDLIPRRRLWPSAGTAFPLCVPPIVPDCLSLESRGSFLTAVIWWNSFTSLRVPQSPALSQVVVLKEKVCVPLVWLCPSQLVWYSEVHCRGQQIWREARQRAGSTTSLLYKNVLFHFKIVSACMHVHTQAYTCHSIHVGSEDSL